MKKYIYENAIVYITKPTVEQIENIHFATEQFAKKLVRRGLLSNEGGKNNRRAGVSHSRTRKRNRWIEKKDRTG